MVPVKIKVTRRDDGQYVCVGYDGPIVFFWSVGTEHPAYGFWRLFETWLWLSALVGTIAGLFV